PPSELVESVPPDLQLSGDKTQKLGNAVKVKASCGDEACIAIAGAHLTNVTEPGKRGQGRVPVGLQPARADLGPGDTTTLKLKLPKGKTRGGEQSVRKKAEKALDKGKKVQAKVKAALGATDAFDHGWDAKRTIRLK
ncbi:MAG TPA: hypothetical protein VE505_02995, partial [Vicinamibacterales bacterium]|nr:hypothetical protein [Vicinamibacterales bacterium]